MSAIYVLYMLNLGWVSENVICTCVREVGTLYVTCVRGVGGLYAVIRGCTRIVRGLYGGYALVVRYPMAISKRKSTRGKDNSITDYNGNEEYSNVDFSPVTFGDSRFRVQVEAGGIDCALIDSRG